MDVNVGCLAAHWRTFVIRGVGAVAFGMLVVMGPPLFDPRRLQLLFAAFALVDGLGNLVLGMLGTSSGRRWSQLFLEGLIGIAAAVFAVVRTSITAMGLLMLIAAWAVATGAAALGAAVRVRRQIRGEWLLSLSGILSVMFGVLLAVFPRAAAPTAAVWIGAYAIAFGALLSALGLRLRTWRPVRKDE